MIFKVIYRFENCNRFIRNGWNWLMGWVILIRSLNLMILRMMKILMILGMKISKKIFWRNLMKMIIS